MATSRYQGTMERTSRTLSGSATNARRLGAAASFARYSSVKMVIHMASVRTRRRERAASAAMASTVSRQRMAMERMTVQVMRAVTAVAAQEDSGTVRADQAATRAGSRAPQSEGWPRRVSSGCGVSPRGAPASETFA